MSPILLLFSTCWVAFVAAWLAKPYDLEDVRVHFERFIEEHNKQYYNKDEKQVRFEIFKENLESVNFMNEKSDHAVFAVASHEIRKYVKGIISDDFCGNYDVIHAVLLVGYGTENGKDYWIVKNSWGEDFGEDGYFRMQRGEDASSCKMLNDKMATSIIL